MPPFGMCAIKAIHGQRGGILEVIKAVTGPRPLFGRIHQAAFQRNVMHVSQFFEPLLFASDVQIVKPPLPDAVRAMKVNGLAVVP